MMTELKANDFPEVYKWLGINLNTLGCVMADLEPLDILQPNWIVPYISKNPERFWIRGWVANENPHVTLLYGLLQKASNYKEHIFSEHGVLYGWHLENVEIGHFDYFNSPYPEEPYYCVIGHVKVSENLLEGHRRLSFLPHINTFTQYTPHVTIAYIEKDEEMLKNFLRYLRKYENEKLAVKEIKLGK